MAITLDTTLGVILDDPKAKAVLDQYLPGVSSNPMVAMARGMSLKMILAMPQAAQFGLTKEKAEAILAEINKQL
jgi:para-nitrobenzyl esterase